MNEVLQTIPFEGEVFVNFGIVKISKKGTPYFFGFMNCKDASGQDSRYNFTCFRKRIIDFATHLGATGENTKNFPNSKVKMKGNFELRTDQRNGNQVWSFKCDDFEIVGPEAALNTFNTFIQDYKNIKAAMEAATPTSNIGIPQPGIPVMPN